jgi:hypothetical protein
LSGGKDSSGNHARKNGQSNLCHQLSFLQAFFSTCPPNW